MDDRDRALKKALDGVAASLDGLDWGEALFVLTASIVSNVVQVMDRPNALHLLQSISRQMLTMADTADEYSENKPAKQRRADRSKMQ
jgi:hypothetical protein